MEVMPEQTDAGGNSLPNGSEKNNRTVSKENIEGYNEDQNEQTSSLHNQEASAAKDAHALPAENGHDSKVNESNDVPDDHVPAVTPPSVEGGGVQPPVATLDETVATDVESPKLESPLESEKQAATSTACDPRNDSKTGAKVVSMDESREPANNELMGSVALSKQEQERASASDDHPMPSATNEQSTSGSQQPQSHQNVPINENATNNKVLGPESATGRPLVSVSRDGTDDQQMTSSPEGTMPPATESIPSTQTTHVSTDHEVIDNLLQNVLSSVGAPDHQSVNSSTEASQNDPVQNSSTHVAEGGTSLPTDSLRGESDELVDTESERMDYDETSCEEVSGDANSNAEHTSAPPAAEVIDLLDSEEEGDSNANESQQYGPPAAKRQRMEGSTVSAGAASYQATAVAQVQNPAAVQQQQQQQQLYQAQRNPTYVDPVPGFIPTWKHLLPPAVTPSAPPQPVQQKRWKFYELSLLNVSEFTITGLRVGDEYSGYTTSVAGLRTHIKKISKGHGNAFFERDPEVGTGKWHIPLGAYQAFYGFLTSCEYHRVEGIPEAQLKIASLGKARLEKDYPSARKLMKFGVPKQLANALAPFQRGGVDFVIDKGGRALIADEMGLGKTIQGIASMSVYHEEWPLLVLCPSSARYHWENEFRHWLGKSSAINDSEHVGAFDGEIEENDSEDEADDGIDCRPAMPLLDNSQIHVLNSGNADILPQEDTKVVICSYGLAPNLVTNGKLFPGMFGCAIVDESHMLKNKATQRTKKLLPVLQATNRCVLLSGTPAFARPLELWPQLQILGTEQHGWGQDEKEYIRKYSRGGSQRRAELHTMLMGTVMIRRMKNDILKTLPAKEREQGIVDVMDTRTRKEMRECMETLRTGKGKLCELARDHQGETVAEQANTQVVEDNSIGNDSNHHDTANGEAAAAHLAAATDQLRYDIEQRRAHGHAEIQRTLMAARQPMDPAMMHSFRQQMEIRLEEQLHTYYRDQVQTITANIAANAASLRTANTVTPQPEPPSEKKAVLNYMYSLTGKCKVPVVVDMLKRWLDDPTKGKLCIFAHHISVLDDIIAGAGLSNALDSTTKYIRIDGSTTPRARQDQINTFQRDSSVRIAILGITAAGVAVTLTASSTVWFAELFWTPAIMIQAEDRCHRIGQQATVKCLYFVAKGTLDEILWKLLENKFQDLGEFVEGKEKMKMVVNKTYHSTHELLKSLTADTMEDDVSDGNSECSLDHVEDLGSELEHEIEELGLSEQRLLDAIDNEGSDSDTPAGLDAKPAAKAVQKDTRGSTEEEAICLSDTDDEDVKVAASNPPTTAGAHPKESTTDDVANVSEEAVAKKPAAFNFNTATFPRLRVYRLWFTGPSFGLNFALIDGRMVVSGRTEGRDQEFGPEAKPHVGDVLVGINRRQLPVVPNMSQIIKVLATAKTQGVVELMFAEDSEITNQAISRFSEEKAAARTAARVVQETTNPVQNGAATAPAAVSNDDGVIEID